jgi:hypothetical protein
MQSRTFDQPIDECSPTNRGLPAFARRSTLTPAINGVAMARTLLDLDLQDVDYRGTFVRRQCHPELLGLVDQIAGYSE